MAEDQTVDELRADVEYLVGLRTVSLWGSRLLLVAAMVLGGWCGLEFTVHGAQAFPLALSVLAVLAGAWGLLRKLDAYGERLETRLEADRD